MAKISEPQPQKIRARGIDRVLDILDYIHARAEPLRISEIASGINAPRSTVYEIVERLIASQMLEYTDRNGRVFLGRRLYFYGIGYSRQFDLITLAKDVFPGLLGDGIQAAQLCMLDGNKYTVAAADSSPSLFRVHSGIGARIPLPWTASGRLLVSHLDDEEIRALIPPEDFVLEDGTQMPVHEFIGEVRAAAARGHSVLKRPREGLFICYAVPVYDFSGRCLATLCLVTPGGDENEVRHLAVLKAKAAELSHRMGFIRAAPSHVA